MLGKIEGVMGMSFSKLQELVMDREAWRTAVHGVSKSRTPPPGDLPKPGIEPRSPELQADSLPFELPGKCIRVTELN